MNDSISRKAAIDEVHGAIYEFFDICDDDEESPMTYKDKQLLELNKAITIRIKQLPSARPKGKWTTRRTEYHDGEWWCTNCEQRCLETVMGKPRWKYCPYCGAEMEVE